MGSAFLPNGHLFIQRTHPGLQVTSVREFPDLKTHFVFFPPTLKSLTKAETKEQMLKRGCHTCMLSNPTVMGGGAGGEGQGRSHSGQGAGATANA